eukprot:366474-Chlamydomonas_euryale.AAC.4
MERHNRSAPAFKHPPQCAAPAPLPAPCGVWRGLGGTPATETAQWWPLCSRPPQPACRRTAQGGSGVGVGQSPPLIIALEQGSHPAEDCVGVGQSLPLRIVWEGGSPPHRGLYGQQQQRKVASAGGRDGVGAW